jgi:hypothetical protein
LRLDREQILAFRRRTASLDERLPAGGARSLETAGAVLVGGEIRGTLRRAKDVVAVAMWGRPSRVERDAIEAEAAGMPIPGLRVRWD